MRVLTAVLPCPLLVTAVLSTLMHATSAPAEPLTYGVRADTGTVITVFTGAQPPDPPFDRVEDRTTVDEVFGVDDLDSIESGLVGSGASAGYAGSGSAVIADGVLGTYATLTAAGSDGVGMFSNGYAGFIDYFTVNLPEGSLVPMHFALNPSYTIASTGGACARLGAFLQVGIDGSPGGTLGYVESTCEPDALLTTVELLVPTGVPFRVLYELSATAFAFNGAQGTATVDALSSLSLFADTAGAYSYTTASGLSYLSPASIPEPAVLSLLGAGMTAAVLRRRHGSSARVK